MAFFITCQDRQINTTILASRRCHGNHHNNRLQCTITVIILTGTVSHCFCLSLSFRKYTYLGTARLLQPRTKQRLPAPKCSQPRYRARDLHDLFMFCCNFSTYESDSSLCTLIKIIEIFVRRKFAEVLLN